MQDPKGMGISNTAVRSVLGVCMINIYIYTHTLKLASALCTGTCQGTHQTVTLLGLQEICLWTNQFLFFHLDLPTSSSGPELSKAECFFSMIQSDFSDVHKWLDS